VEPIAIDKVHRCLTRPRQATTAPSSSAQDLGRLASENLSCTQFGEQGEGSPSQLAGGEGAGVNLDLLQEAAAADDYARHRFFGHVHRYARLLPQPLV
jgi:hypothetical protein